MLTSCKILSLVYFSAIVICFLEYGEIQLKQLLSHPTNSLVHIASNKLNLIIYDMMCNTAVSTYSDLKEHIWTHTGERSFKCKLSELTFNQKSILTHEYHQMKEYLLTSPVGYLPIMNQ